MFDLTKVEENSFSALPAGTYAAVVTGAEIKTTNSGTGKYLKVELTIATQGFEGRKIFTNFNTENTNTEAVKIGLGQLKSMAKAIGFSDKEMSALKPEMLAGKEVGIKTKIKNDPQWGEKAEVVSYMALKDAPAHVTTTKDSIPF